MNEENPSLQPESMVLHDLYFIEDQTFSLSSDLAPPPPPPFSKLVWRHTRRLRKRDNLLTGVGGGGGRSYGRGAESNDDEKTWSSVDHSILSDCSHRDADPVLHELGGLPGAEVHHLREYHRRNEAKAETPTQGR